MAKKLTGSAKTAWNAFAQWVKINGCIKTTGYPFVGVCITCRKRFHIRSLQAGHSKGGRNNAILFHEALTNPQCVICNETHHGLPKKYRKILVMEFGEKQVEVWEREVNEIIPNWDMDYEAIKLKYRAATTILLIPFGYKTYQEMLQGHQL